jgi:hypothetical protein
MTMGTENFRVLIYCPLRDRQSNKNYKTDSRNMKSQKKMVTWKSKVEVVYVKEQGF